MSGVVWALGDDVDTDVLAPGPYLKAPIPELATHCLEAVEPRFAAEVRPGDVIVAGHNFGAGSSREQAVLALRELGVTAVVARCRAAVSAFVHSFLDNINSEQTVWCESKSQKLQQASSSTTSDIQNFPAPVNG